MSHVNGNSNASVGGGNAIKIVVDLTSDDEMQSESNEISDISHAMSNAAQNMEEKKVTSMITDDGNRTSATTTEESQDVEIEITPSERKPNYFIPPPDDEETYYFDEYLDEENQVYEEMKTPSVTKKRRGSTNKYTPKKRRSSATPNKIQKSMILKCTACPRKCDAEVLHPILKVPICGACHLTVKARDTSLDGQNEKSCIWCGREDDVNLMFCDDCRYSWCYECIERNFGKAEAQRVKDKPVWACYTCTKSTKLAAIQADENTTNYYSLDRAYASVRPPKERSIENDAAFHEIIGSLTLSEKRFAAFFCDEILNVPFNDLNIMSYLTAHDLLPVVGRLSKGLRRFFQSRVFIIPGLFQTPYGLEHMCRLHDHQVVSLHTMTQIENQSREFGVLRGGIFADEPGLGKTVTVLALIASTAGIVPNKPKAFWDDDTIDTAWTHLTSQHEALLAPILSKLRKLTALAKRGDSLPEMMEIKKRMHEGTFPNIQSFEHAVKDLVKQCHLTKTQRDLCYAIISHEVMQVKAGLDSKKRTLNSRVQMERKLYPSSATLIIVPTVLLEHWYEQILRHLNLEYFSREEHFMKHVVNAEYQYIPRGVVYIDGLGDIVDLHGPLTRVNNNYEHHISAYELSNYLIVITTLEKCAVDCMMSPSTNSLVAASLKGKNEAKSANKTNSAASDSILLTIRWLRLIIDEGHEIGRKQTDHKHYDTIVKTPFNDKFLSKQEEITLRATHFISYLAAERRWIMSGTPTTGAHSDIGLMQLYRLLCFLRHPVYTSGEISVNKASSDGASAVTVTPSQTNLSPLQAEEMWRRKIVMPCMRQDSDTWEAVTEILRKIMVRHMKEDIDLFPPIHHTHNTEMMPLPQDIHSLDNPRTLAIDRAKAHYIATTMLQAKKDYKEFVMAGGNSMSRSNLNAVHSSTSNKADAKTLLQMTRHRRPKAIVFSQHTNDLQGVGHFLYQFLGDANICELLHSTHYKSLQSVELSRFRHSKRTFRRCLMCGHKNHHVSSSKEDMNCCEKVLYCVEYLDQDINGSFATASTANYPLPGGHGESNCGGHYTGRCLCTPLGCPYNTQCASQYYPNALYNIMEALEATPQTVTEHNLAIIAEEHIESYRPNATYQVGDLVNVIPAKACEGAANMSVHDIVALQRDNPSHSIPLLWYGGRRGGKAIIRQWRRCGGKSKHRSWHGNKILRQVPWQVEEEDAMVLLLQQEGSTGLDLSFATHIFLLERIADPALKNQIISRAHRVGALGPVQVTLVQVAVEDADD